MVDGEALTFEALDSTFTRESAGAHLDRQVIG
jgi:hypothetical protein